MLAAVVEPLPRRRLVATALFLLALAAGIVALARPAIARTVLRDDSTVVLTIDTSGSMDARDVRPTRLDAAKSAIRRFVEHLPGKYRVAIVAFASTADLLVPPTHDHELAVRALRVLSPGGGTAIGDALGRSLDLLQPPRRAGDPPEARDKPPQSAIVLLTDGEEREGRLQPLAAAARATALAIPVYTVALGTPNGEVAPGRSSVASLMIPSRPSLVLRRIAAVTGGAFFTARTRTELDTVYERLAPRLRPSREFREATSLFLGGAAVFLLGAGLLSARWASRLP